MFNYVRVLFLNTLFLVLGLLQLPLQGPLRIHGQNHKPWLVRSVSAVISDIFFQMHFHFYNLTPDLLRMEEPTGLKLSISLRISLTRWVSESTNLKLCNLTLCYCNTSSSLDLPKRSYVDLIILKVFKIQGLHIEGGERVMILSTKD